jgi:hypothetical protein
LWQREIIVRAAATAFFAELGLELEGSSGTFGRDACGKPGSIIRAGMDTRACMDGQSENPGQSRSELIVAGLAPPDGLETDEVPETHLRVVMARAWLPLEYDGRP